MFNLSRAQGTPMFAGLFAAILLIFSDFSYAQFQSVTAINSLPVSAISGEKPQSKVWTYAGNWWMVMPNSSGTHLWRLDSNAWTSVLDLSSATSTFADCKPSGNITHILLYEGVSSSLVSVEYVPASNSYQLWSVRPSTVPITLDTGVETASIDIDSNGRMWAASAGTTTVNVRWSDYPYSSWSTPIEIASGINDDDICAVIAFSGKIGVLWSNQNTQRFGFKYHTDGADPSVWSADEVPASQSALNVGAGMADDHLNIKAASDGTLYAAVKTSYDTPGYPKIAMLIRRPGGTWDDLYTVDESGTRGVMILNESGNKLFIVYSSAEGNNPIVYKSSSLTTIAFGARTTLISSSCNDITGTKQNLIDNVVLLASNGSTAYSVLAADNTLAGHWAMEENAGAIALADSSPNGNTAAVTGSLNQITGQRGYGQSFDGTNDFAAAPNSTSLNITNQITLAAWIKPGNNTTQDLLSKRTNGSTDGYELTLSASTASVSQKIFFRINQKTSGDTYRVNSTTTYPTDGSWIHAAATFSGDTMKLYINGVLESSIPAAVSIAGNNLPFCIGAQNDGTRKFTGALDDIRVYNVALNQSEIQSLLSTWAPPVSAPPVPILSSPADLSTDIAVSPVLSWSASTGASSYQVQVSAVQDFSSIIFNQSGITGTSVNISPALLNNTTYYWRVNASNTSGTSSWSTVWSFTTAAALTIQDNGSGYALDFDGTNDYVVCGNNSSVQITGTAITMEAWIKPTKVGTMAVLKKTGAIGGGTGYELYCGSAGFVYCRFNGTDASRAISTTAYPINGSWIHIAATYNGTDTKLYVNGVLEGSTAYSTPISNSSNILEIANDPSTALRFFQGSIDEVRLWNVVRSDQEIRDYMTRKLTGSETGLVGYWRMDETSGTLVKDETPNANNGALLNMDPATDRIWSSAALGDESANDYNSTGGFTASLNHTDGDNLSAVTTSGTISGIQVYRADDNAVRSGSTVPEGYSLDPQRFWGVKVIGTASPAYTLVYNYTGNPSVTSEYALKLVKRNAVSDPAWVDAIGTVDTAANTITLTGAAGTEYALALPIITPPAAPSDLAVSNITSSSMLLNWTDNSTNETGFELERSVTGSGGTFTLLTTLPADSVSYRDSLLVPGTEYCYRVRSVNSSGSSAYSNIICGTTLAPPAAPSDLAVSNITSSSILLNWTDNSTNETGFELERSVTGSGGTFTLLATLPADSVSYRDSLLVPGTEYCYRVRSVNSSESSAYSNIICGTTLAPPVAPSDLAVSNITSSSILLNWTDNSTNETGFELERSVTGSGGTFTLLVSLPADSVSYRDSLLVPGTEYCYRVRSVNSSGSSAYSNIICGTTLAPPVAPSDLAVSNITYSSILLNWTDSSSNETGFEIERSGSAAGDTVGNNVLTNGDMETVGNWNGSHGGIISYSTEEHYEGNYSLKVETFGPGSGTNNYTWSNPLNDNSTYWVEGYVKITTPGAWVIMNFQEAHYIVEGNGDWQYFKFAFNVIPQLWQYLTFFEYNQGSTNITFYLDAITVKKSVEPFTLLASLPANTNLYTDSLLTEGTEYCYRVRALNSSGYSSYSNVNCATTLFMPPAEPSGLTARVISGTSIELNWVDNSSNEWGFRIERSVDGSLFNFQAMMDPDVLTYTDTSVSPGVQYCYKIAAFNLGGISSFTNIECAIPFDRTLNAHWALEESGGSTVLADSSGFGNDAAVTGSLTQIDGQRGFGQSLDGTNDYALVPDTSTLNFTNGLTLAAWIRPGNNTTQDLISKRTMSSVDGYELSLSSSTASAVQKVFVRFNQKTYGDTLRLNSVTTYPTNGSWIHAGATYDGDTIKLYINGILESSMPAAVTIAGNTLPVSIGAQNDGIRKFTGGLDDIRIYNYALSQSEIQSLLTLWDPPLTIPAAPVLVSPADSTAGIDLSPLLEWNPVIGASTYQVQVSTTPEFSNIVFDQSGISATSTAVIPRLINSTVYYWRVNASNTIGTGEWSSVWSFTTEAPPVFENNGAGYAIDFDGTNDYVNCGNDTSVQISGTAITMEAWIKPSKVGTLSILKKTGPIGGGAGYELYCGSAGFVYCRFNGDDASRAASTTSYPIDGTWLHVAATYDGANTKLYVNGVLESATAYTAPIVNSTNLLFIGNDASTAAKFFQGTMDEVRLWNVVRSDTEIKDYMTRKLTGTETGLVGYWRMDEMNGTLVKDETANGNNGTMINMDPAIDRIWSSAALGDGSANDYNSTGGFTASLSHTDGDNLSAVTTAGTISGIQVYRADDNAVRSGSTIPEGYSLDPQRFWGVKIIGTASPAYTLVYNYSGNPAVTSEYALKLVKRNAVSDPAWIDASALLDTAANTLTITGAAGTEYALAISNIIPPLQPVLISPPGNGTNISTSPELSVMVSDPESRNLTVSFYGRPKMVSQEPFSIIVLPDAQNYTSGLNGGLPSMFTDQTQWCINNRTARNIQYVSFLGDLTNDNSLSKWQNADTSISLLDATGPGIPYGIALGNHDLENPPTLYGNYFPASRFAGRSYYGGSFDSNNENNYGFFSSGGLDFIVINLSSGSDNPSGSVLAWADSLLKANSTKRAIVVNHSLLNTGIQSAFTAPGQVIYDSLKDNSNLFLMMGGHLSGEGRRSDTFNGNTLFSLLSDYQDLPGGGNGYLRIMEFDPPNNQIHVSTYSPTLDSWMNSSDSRFDLPYIMQTNDFQLIGTDTAVVSGSTVSRTWPGLSNSTEYEWYVTVSNSEATVTGPVWSFTTKAPPVAVNARIMLEGFCGGSSSMTTALNSNNLIPLNSNDAYSGTEYGYTPAIVGSIPSSDISDWVLLELRTGISSGTKIITKAAFLKNDGSIVDINGTSPVIIEDVPSGDYYITVFHRNHLSVISANPVTINQTGMLYDFTTGPGTAYENKLKLLNGNWCLFAGDVNHDGLINSTDVNQIYTDNVNGLTGYNTSDLNGDTYTEIEDINIVFINNVLGTINTKPVTIKRTE